MTKIPLYENPMLVAPHAPCALAIGNFDGVHRGHQAVLKQARACAKTHNLPLGILLFVPHPRMFFAPDTPPFQLTQLDQRAALLGQYGGDFIIAMPFDAALGATLADDFITQILCASAQAKHIIIGADFHYGKGRSGNAESLMTAGKQHGFGVDIIAPAKDETGVIFSSSQCRDALRKGDVRRANQILGRDWTIKGQVQNGEARGRQIGFPTANIHMDDYLHPAYGVYAVRVRLPDGSRHKGVANFGVRPTLDGTRPKLEVHLFDFADDIYGSHIDVALVDFIRREQKFEGLDALKEQIARDCTHAHKLLV